MHRNGERDTDENILRQLIEAHYRHTGSLRAREILNDWQRARQAFVKVMPTEYLRALKTLWTQSNELAA